MSAAAGGDELAGVAARAEPVLRAAGVPADHRLVPITGGGNNRLFRVESAAAPVMLKAYFRHPEDPRDRLRAEFGFSSFAWDVGARALPRPLASDRDAGMAVYEFIAGRKLVPGEVTAGHVAAAVDFFRSVDGHRGDPRAAGLPEASEACFSIAAHVACVDDRMARLGSIDAGSPLGHEAIELVGRRLWPAWRHVRESVLAAAGSTVDERLPPADRCLSPSDFGFHNAILATDGRLRFLDFEYAGHDDPAKMICDFFCQPAIPVPGDFRHVLIEGVEDDEPRKAALGERVRILDAVYELKWCCILLNDFVGLGSRRRIFSGSYSEVRQRQQLIRLQEILDRVTGVH